MSIISKSISLFMTYKFLRILTTPFNKTDAFKLGIIDKDGNILRRYRSLNTTEEKDSYTMYHRLIWKLKRLLEKVPFGKATVSSYLVALWLLKEHVEKETNNLIEAEEIEMKFKNFLIQECGIHPDTFDSELLSESKRQGATRLKAGLYRLKDSNQLIETCAIPIGTVWGFPIYEAFNRETKEFIEITEDAVVTTNNTGSGNVAGLGVGPQGEPGRVGKFAGYKVFKVNGDSFHKSLHGKKAPHRYSKYVDEEDDEIGSEIREYGRKNPGKGIILQHEKSGEMIFLKRGKQESNG